MFLRATWLSAWLVFVFITTMAASASAWVETAVRSHRATVTLAPDGQATVRHELVLKLRGGPMKLLEIGGMGTDIEPLPDADVRRAIEGSASMWPLIPESQQDGSLRLTIGAPRGIRGGSYLFSFGYKLDLAKGKLLEAADGGIVVTWIGPRLSSGVDSAQVTFVVPRGERPPRLPKAAPEERGELQANVLVGELRRGEKNDEIDLVRAHLATGEPAVWRVWIGRDALALDLAHDEEPSPVLSEFSSQRQIEPYSDGLDATRSLWSIVIALMFFGLLLSKARNVAELCRLTDARAKPLIVVPPLLRAGLGAGALGAAVWFAIDHQPTWAIGLGVFAAMLGTYLLPVREVRPRGPGRWMLMDPKSERDESLPGALWETRSLPGFSLCLVLVVVILFVAYRILPLSNYLALMTVALSVLVFPLFWTGGRGDFPQSPLRQARPWFRKLERAFEPDIVHVQLWGRRAGLAETDSGKPDEVRIRFVLHSPPSGLRAFEVAFEEAAGAHVMPCVVLRVLDESRALHCLPRDLPWQRGRTPEERVALLRPSAPTLAQLLRLLRSLISTLRAARLVQPTSEARSPGSSDLASKVGGSVPAHPM